MRVKVYRGWTKENFALAENYNQNVILIWVKAPSNYATKYYCRSITTLLTPYSRAVTIEVVGPKF